VPVFLDTTMGVYAFGQYAAKIERTESILGYQPTISVEVVNEFLSVYRMKLGFDLATRHRLASELLAGCNVVSLDARVVVKAMEIESQSGIPYSDALIVAAAILSRCETLYSEDFQHLRVFDGLLTVVNPFV
jgi:predicted nucleic acid-binding protein